MSLQCIAEGCRGRIKSGMSRGLFWEGDEYECPKCHAAYVIGVTDDYADDCIAYLIAKTPKRTK